MRRSTDRILTTHVGSLPEPSGLDPEAPGYEERLKREVEAVVARQRQTGIDIINEGEFTKGGDWLSFIETRFGGFEVGERPAGEVPLVARGKDREQFAEFYQYATERGSLFYTPGNQIRTNRPYWVCTGPVTYTGEAELAREIALLKEAASPSSVRPELAEGQRAASPSSVRPEPVEGQEPLEAQELFLTSTAAASLEVYRRNDYYKTEEEYLYAITEALAVEYHTIAAAGIILQVDDAWLPALWDRIGIDMGLEAFRKRSDLRVEALNHALKGIPEEQVRYHLCWGSWHGPHAYDLELKHLVDIMLKVNAQAYLIEGANARHEHEWTIWQDTKLPEGKILIPGVITHSTDVVEHPEIVSQRLQNYARVIGKENVIAGADCGFGGRSHPQIAWAKLHSLVEGARLASQALWA